MLKLNLREIAKDLDVAIDSLEQAQRILIGLENGTVTDEHRDKIRELSKSCLQLKNIREETGIMVLERVMHLCNVQQAIVEIANVLEDFKDARSLINI